MKWYEIKDKAGNTEIWIYDEIGLWGITAKDFVKDLSKIKTDQIDLHINSPGGSVWDGNAIYNALKNHKAEITTYIDGIAASIASVIALAGDKIIMAKNALFMIHNASGLTFGTAEDMRETALILDKIDDTLVTSYVDKTKMSEKEIKNLMDKETWFSAKEAKENGFVDVIGKEIEIAACVKFVVNMEKLGYKHIPEIKAEEKKYLPNDTNKGNNTATPSSDGDNIYTPDPSIRNGMLAEEDSIFGKIKQIKEGENG